MPNASEEVGRSERQIKSGILGERSSFRLLVQGPITAKDLSGIIEALRLDRDAMREDECKAKGKRGSVV